jgi:hypothetical protein
VLKTNVITPGLSDHSIVTADIELNSPHQRKYGKESKRVIRIHRKADVVKFRDLISKTSDKLSHMTDVQKMWDTFSTDFKEAVDAAVPKETIKVKKQDQPPWFNEQARKLHRKQQALYRKYKETNDLYFYHKHRMQSRANKKSFRQIKKQYITEKICGPLEKGNSKPFYKHLRQKQKCDHPVTAIKLKNGNITTDSMDCSEALNQYFHSQFCKDESISNLPPLPTSDNYIVISPDGIHKLIKDLKNNKSPGPDQIRKCELLIDPAMTAECLTYIFQASVDSGVLPHQWKTAYVTPIHKRGAREEPSNYRPISLTSIPCKMLEHIVLHHLNGTLDSVLYNRQHGFRSGLGCETQLCATFHDLAKAIEKGAVVHGVVLDFKKAFDKVPHSLLMQKVRNIDGIDPNIANWIQNFLTNRRQRVALRGTLSTELPVSSGVPQGSVLGPTLFLIYINDLPQSVTCNVSLYADDTLIYSEVNSIRDAQLFQENINALQEWSVRWKMPFNTDKCEVIVFNKGSSPTPSYTLGDSKLKCVDETRYLGITVQSNLKFNKHITKKINDATRVLGCIKYTLYEAPEKGKLLAYTSLCRPLLEYGDTLWDPPDSKTSDTIEQVQNRAIRFIKNIKGRHGVTEARDQLELRSLKDRRKTHRLSLLMRILSDNTKHQTLASAYEELVNGRSQTTMTTRAAESGKPNSIYASSQTYYHSFLPRSVRELRLLPNSQI